MLSRNPETKVASYMQTLQVLASSCLHQ